MLGSLTFLHLRRNFIVKQMEVFLSRCGYRISSIASDRILSVCSDVVSWSSCIRSRTWLISCSPENYSSYVFSVLFWCLEPIFVPLWCVVILGSSSWRCCLRSSISIFTSIWLWPIRDSGNTSLINQLFLDLSRDWLDAGASLTNLFLLQRELRFLHDRQAATVCWPYAHVCRLYIQVHANLSYSVRYW